MRRWSALRELVRLKTHTRAWQETAPLAVALAPIPTILPTVNLVLQELGWWFGPAQRSLVRRDRLGVLRHFSFGSDGLAVLHEWLADWHRREALQACGRVHRGYHRPTAGLASGLLFPAVAPGVLCTFAGHRKLYDQGDLYLRQLCLGHGCSAWDKAARYQLEALPDCRCGLPQPSRPHLVWHCAEFPRVRDAVGPAADRLAERLLAREVPEKPAPPVALDCEGLEEELAEALCAAWPVASAELFVATDGSSFSDVASYAVCIEDGADFAGRTSRRIRPSFLLLPCFFEPLVVFTAKARCGWLWTASPCRTRLQGMAPCVRWCLRSPRALQCWRPLGSGCDWSGSQAMESRCPGTGELCQVPRLLAFGI